MISKKEARARLNAIARAPCPFFGYGGRTEHCLHFRARFFRKRDDWCCVHRTFERRRLEQEARLA